MDRKKFQNAVKEKARKAAGAVSEALQTVRDFSDMGKYPESPRVSRSDSEAQRTIEAMERQGQIPKNGSER